MASLVLPIRHRSVKLTGVMLIAAALGLSILYGVSAATAGDPGALSAAIQSRIDSATGATMNPPTAVFSPARGDSHQVDTSLSSSGNQRCMTLDDSYSTCFAAGQAGGMSSMLGGGKTAVWGYTPDGSETVIVTWQGREYTGAVRSHFYLVEFNAPQSTEPNGWPAPVRPTIAFR